MDIGVQEAQVYAQIEKNSLYATIYYQNLLYQCHYSPNNNIGIAPIKSSLENKQFQIIKEGKKLKVIIANGILTLQFHHCCSKHWIQIGDLSRIPKIFEQYPVTHYQFGIIYNGPMIMPIIVNRWNRGYRVTTRDLYPSGDNAKSMKPVRAMFTKDTDDQQSKRQKWYHQYVDENYKPFNSNGNQNPKLFIRKM